MMQESAKQPLQAKTTPAQFVLLLLFVLLLSAIGSHLVMFVLGIREKAVQNWSVGTAQTGPAAQLLGSSMTYFALDRTNISTQLKSPLECQWVSAASSCEVEILARKFPGAKTTIVALSLYDQNERILSDYRSDIVPLSQTVRDLWTSGSDWSFAKRTLAQYPLKYVRTLFPTSGRSFRVMTATQARVLALLRGERQPELTIVDFDNPSLANITDWTPSELVGKVTIIRNFCQGRHQFNGPKSLAFKRLVADAAKRGRVVVIILPVSPEYRRQLLSNETLQQFEKSLADVRAATPQATWLRIDQLPELNDDSCYGDLVHMGAKGKRLATDAVCRALSTVPQ